MPVQSAPSKTLFLPPPTDEGASFLKEGDAELDRLLAESSALLRRLLPDAHSRRPPVPNTTAARAAEPHAPMSPPPPQQQQEQPPQQPAMADFEPADFRANGAASAPPPAGGECVNLLLRESFLDGGDDDGAAGVANVSAPGSLPSAMPTTNNGNGMQRQINEMYSQQAGQPPNQPLRAQLSQLSQQQMQQFALEQLWQRNLQQQEEVRLQMLLHEQQLQQQAQLQPQAQTPQSSAQSIRRSDLQALQALHQQNEAGGGPSPQAKQGRKKPRRRSASMDSHNPRVDDLSHSDAAVQEKAARKAGGSDFHYVQVVGGGLKRRATVGGAAPPNGIPSPGPRGGTKTHIPPKQPRPASAAGSLQEYLDSLLASRGYIPRRRPASELGYRRPPTPLQLASFGSAVCATIKPGGAERLASLLRAGLSPNPTNKFGDSPFFLACKRGYVEAVRAFLDAGAEVRVADGFGRTPLHHVAWSNPPSLAAARRLLRAAGPAGGRLLYVTDAHGKTPLDFVGERHRSAWVEFLEEVKDECWPARGDRKAEYFPDAREDDGAAVDPEGALSPELAAAVASGSLPPEQAQRRLLQHEE